MLACCRINDGNPVEYLTDVLPRLSGRVRLLDLSALLSASWKASGAAVVLATPAT